MPYKNLNLEQLKAERQNKYLEFNEQHAELEKISQAIEHKLRVIRIESTLGTMTEADIATLTHLLENAE
jgi:hypothetical protein